MTLSATDTIANLLTLDTVTSVNGIRLNKAGPAIQISLDSGSTLRFVGGGSNGTWSGMSVYEQDLFLGNSALAVGNQFLLNFHSANTLGANATTYARLIVEQGGLVSLSNNATSYGQTIHSLSDGGGTGGIITNLSANATVGTAILTIAGNETKTFSGSIVDGASAGTGLGGVNGVVAITKSGSGTQIFSGTGAYTGNTTVNAGTLVINGNFSGATGAVSVASGATLGGNGTIGGATTVNGNLSPGNSPGLLTFSSSLTLGANSTTTMEISGTGRGLTYDAVDVGASQLLTYGGTLTLTMTGALTNGTYNLFSFTSGFNTGNFSSIAFAGGYYTGTWSRVGDLWTSTLTQGQIWSFDQASGDLVAAIPEPSTWALVGLGAGSLALWRRRNRKG